MDTVDTIRKNIPMIVKDKRLFYDEICAPAGVSYRALKTFINGDSDMSIGTVNRIAQALGYTLTGLINWRQK